jgi:hypothetical protein
METCLNATHFKEKMGQCAGEVALRPSLTGTGTPIARCDKHWRLACEREYEHRRVYPDSPNPPSWFDPSIAGESWDAD